MTFPNDEQRISIVGTTGSGKTHSAVYQLSQRNFDVKPWVIFDYKGDPLINSIPRATHISLDSKVPEQPGIYIVHPTFGQESEVQNLLWEIWAQENVGVYIDEGIMMEKYNPPYRACLTQGRSKHIPMIVLCQRPVWIDPFTFSESEFFQVFYLGWAKDNQKMMEFIPYDLEKRLPPRYSYYYDKSSDKLYVMRPAPDRNAILDTFDVKLRNIRKVV